MAFVIFKSMRRQLAALMSTVVSDTPIRLPSVRDLHLVDWRHRAYRSDSLSTLPDMPILSDYETTHDGNYKIAGQQFAF